MNHMGFIGGSIGGSCCPIKHEHKIQINTTLRDHVNVFECVWKGMGSKTGFYSEIVDFGTA